VSLFAVSVFSSVVYADTGSAAFCPNYWWQDLDTENEIYLSTTITEYVADCLDDRYGYCFLNTDEDATVSDYADVIWTLNVAYDQAVFFSKGHRGIWVSNHRSLCDHYGDDVRDSVEIYNNTSEDFLFCFIWHCESAEIYPSSQDQYGWRGMPYCWTHDNNMQQYGSSTDHTYLGWYEGSPQMEYDIDEQYPWLNWTYAHFTYLFFETMYYDYTVYETLNYLAGEIWSEQYFSGTELWFKLMVLGNGGATLP
jgi:hypothetical protein